MGEMTTREEVQIIRMGEGWRVDRRLRQKILERLGDIIDDDEESPRNHIAAAETVLKIEMVELQRQRIQQDQRDEVSSEVQQVVVALPLNGSESDDQ